MVADRLELEAVRIEPERREVGLRLLREVAGRIEDLVSATARQRVDLAHPGASGDHELRIAGSLLQRHTTSSQQSSRG